MSLIGDPREIPECKEIGVNTYYCGEYYLVCEIDETVDLDVCIMLTPEEYSEYVWSLDDEEEEFEEEE